MIIRGYRDAISKLGWRTAFDLLVWGRIKHKIDDWTGKNAARRRRSEANHAFHVWINQRQYDRRLSGEPWEHSLYEFKDMLLEIPRLALIIGQERRGELPKTHRQCSMQPAEKLMDNCLTCCLGEKVANCNILKSLRASVADSGKQKFAVPLDDEDVDELCARVCAWHVYSTATGVDEEKRAAIDTSEGYILTTSDRVYWDRVYENLSAPIDDDEAERAAAEPT